MGSSTILRIETNIAANDTGSSRNGFDSNDLLSREEKFMHPIY